MSNSVEPSFQEVPKILLIDIDDPDVTLLRSKGYNCTTGTLGKQVTIPNKSRDDDHICLLNYDLAANLHEFNIIVVNLQSVKTIDYEPSQHKHTVVKGKTTGAIRISYPQTIFDPRPLASSILSYRLSSFSEKLSVIITFTSSIEDLTYELVEISQYRIETREERTESVFSFVKALRLPGTTNIAGKGTHVARGLNNELNKLLNGHNEETEYNIVFSHPTKWDDQENRQVERESFLPLMRNMNDQIISYADFDPKTSVFMFPIIPRKGEFLSELFQSVLPPLFSTLFPNSSQFTWLSDIQYQLPNEELLISERRKIEEKYAKELEEADKKIHENHEKYSWLHDLLTGTGPHLVKTVEQFFDWLDFPKVINVDELDPELKEEDLRVEFEQKLLVVEIKGIGGTSTDSDCSQISKIRYRRGKERSAYDVFALYIVNHQLNLPPEERANPPFQEQQIEDAKSDDRGLCTTYELFKLYFYIEDGLITKEAAQASLLEFGLVQFTPSNAILLGTPLKIHYGGTVAILNLDDVSISKGTVLIVRNRHSLRRVNVIDLRVNNESVAEASSGSVSLKLDHSISETDEIWLPST